MLIKVRRCKPSDPVKCFDHSERKAFLRRTKFLRLLPFYSQNFVEGAQVVKSSIKYLTYHGIAMEDEKVSQMAVNLEVTETKERNFFTARELPANDMLWKEKEGTITAIYWEVDGRGVTHHAHYEPWLTVFAKLAGIYFGLMTVGGMFFPGVVRVLQQKQMVEDIFQEYRKPVEATKMDIKFENGRKLEDQEARLLKENMDRRKPMKLSCCLIYWFNLLPSCCLPRKNKRVKLIEKASRRLEETLDVRSLYEVRSGFKIFMKLMISKRHHYLFLNQYRDKVLASETSSDDKAAETFDFKDLPTQSPFQRKLILGAFPGKLLKGSPPRKPPAKIQPLQLADTQKVTERSSPKGTP